MTKLAQSKRPAGAAGAFHAQWQALAAVYPTYAAAARQFRHGQPPFERLEDFAAGSAEQRAACEQATSWLDDVDKLMAVQEFRKVLLNAGTLEPATLPVLVGRYLKKAEKTGADRDKLDFLLSQCLATGLPAGLGQHDLSMEEVARQLEPMVGKAMPPAPEAAMEHAAENAALEELVDEMDRAACLADLDALQIIQRGRELKVQARERYFEPASLLAFARFSYLLRAHFHRLLHADLGALETALDALEARGERTVNCSAINLSSAEPLSSLRDMARNWRRPDFQDYTELSFQRIVQLGQVAKTALDAMPATQDEKLRSLELRLSALTEEVHALRQQVERKE